MLASSFGLTTRAGTRPTQHRSAGMGDNSVSAQSPTLIDRRTAIISLAAAIAAGCSGRVPVDGLKASLSLEFDEETSFEAHTSMGKVADRIGREYARLFPVEDEPKSLCQLLFGTDVPPNIEDMKIKLKTRVREDFRRDELVSIEGWYLTRSEGRLCCLSVHYGFA